MDELTNANNPERNGSAGPIVGVIIILAVIVLGGLYFWSQRAGTNLSDESVNNRVETINSQSDSDELTSIEADLEATDIDTLDAGLNASN